MFTCSIIHATKRRVAGGLPCTPMLIPLSTPNRSFFCMISNSEPRTPDLLTKDLTPSVCYGVADTQTVRIDPGVGDVKLTDKACLTITPKQTTTYTLTAIGLGNESIRQQITVTVKRTEVSPRPPGKLELKNRILLSDWQRLISPHNFDTSRGSQSN